MEQQLLLSNLITKHSLFTWPNCLCCRYQAKRLEGTVSILFPLQHPWYPKSPPQLSLISWSNILADKHFLCSVAQLQRCRVFSRLCQQLLVSTHTKRSRKAQLSVNVLSELIVFTTCSYLHFYQLVSQRCCAEWVLSEWVCVSHLIASYRSLAKRWVISEWR